MTPGDEERNGRDDGREHSRRVGATGVALVLLLIGVCIALVWETPAGRLRWSDVAAADGGSTIPIPPPTRPTPQSIAPTPTRSGAATNAPIYLDLGNLHLSNGTRVETRDGDLIPLTGGAIRVEDDTSGDQRIILPFALSPGREVSAFQDPESGMYWLPTAVVAGGGDLRIPLPGGRVPGVLAIELGPLQGKGQKTSAPVLGAALDIGPVELEGDGSRHGAVQLSAALRRLPPYLALDLRSVAPDSPMMLSLDEAAGTLGEEVASIAYAAAMEAGFAGEVASASIQMSVEEEWATAWPGDRIRIVRIDNDGNARILTTASAGNDALGHARFIAESPEGLSTFALIALEEPAPLGPSQGPSWPPGLGIGLGLVALLGLGAGVYLLVMPLRRGANT